LTVLIPEENAKDLVEIADSIKSGLEIVPVSRMDEVLARAMTRKPEPIEWDSTMTAAATVPKEASKKGRSNLTEEFGVPTHPRLGPLPRGTQRHTYLWGYRAINTMEEPNGQEWEIE
jgi:Lon protease (S16) C-terminal proteolytic domain